MRRGEVIEQRIAALVRKRWTADLAAFLLLGLGVAVLALLVVSLLFWAGWLVWLTLVPMAVVAWVLAARNRFWNVCREVEGRFAEVRGKLIVAIELAGWGRKPGTVPRRKPGDSPWESQRALRRDSPRFSEGYSEEMIDAAVADVERALEPLPLTQLVNRRQVLWSVLVLLGACALFAAAAFGVAPARAQVGLRNALVPGARIVEFSVLPGDTAVMPGGVVAIRAQVRPAGVFATARLAVAQARSPRPETRNVRLDRDTCRVVVAAGHGFKYRFSALGQSSPEYRVRVIEPLSIERLEITVRPPPYSKLPETRVAGADVSALKGSVVDIAGEANRVMSAGRIVLGGDTLPVTIGLANGGDSTRFRARFAVRADATGAIELADSEDRVLLPAQVLRVRALADEPPFVKLFLPGRDIDLPVSMKALLAVNSLDDFGLGELLLHYGKDTIDQRRRLKSLSGRREDTTLFAWDLTDAGLLPGEQMRYFVSVTDNDAVSGPKVSRTETFTIRFPTMTEIYNAAVRQTERTASELGPMQSEQAQLGEELNRLSEEMKKSRELSWDEKQALEKVLESQEGLMAQVSDLKQEVSDLMKELSSGMTLDEQTMERMGQLQQLLSELLPRELQQSLAQLREKLEQQSPDVKRALEKFELDQEKMKQAIDRALELLKKIMEEQRLEALARKAEELAKAQKELTEELGKEAADKSAEMQQDIKEALDSLQKEMQSLADSMSDREIGDSLSKLAQLAEQEKLSEMAQQLANQMRAGKTGQSKPESDKLAQRLKRMSESLSALSQQLKQKRSSEVTRKLQDAASQLLMVSAEQEKLEQVAPQTPDLSERASTQMGLHEASRIVAESLASLASRTMSVKPQLGQELAKAMNEMEQAAQAMAENRGSAAQHAMALARQSLNRTVQALLEAMAESQQGGGMSGGMESLMQQLSQMTGDQMGINAGMSGFPIPIPGGLSPGQMAALGRILAKQRALREQLQQMLESMGGTQPGLTGSLEGLVEEMQAVERDLAELNVTRELIERQESILSHLLDAQRSIRQQGFKEERQSESGKPFELKERPKLPEDKGERNRLLREELMRALKQGYPAEYEQMIRDYFRRLLNE